MKKAREIKNDLSKASDILLVCNQKAMVLKVCTESAWEDGCFPGIEEQDSATVRIGMGTILSEIVEHVSEATDLITGAETCIDGLGKPAKEARA